MKKVMVIGCPGAGKSYFSKQLSILWGLPLYHMDCLYWNKDRTCISRNELVEKLQNIMQNDCWLIDGNYNATMEMRMESADTVIYLDYSTEQCIEGISERVGKERDDIPWVEGQLDEEFLQFVQKFRENSKPAIEQLLKKYGSKEILRFHTRKDADQFLIEQMPENIRPYLLRGEHQLITENHRSGDLVYQIQEKYILKISRNQARLIRERRGNDFLDGKLPVSESIAYTEQHGTAYYLKTCVLGTQLLAPQYLKDPERLAGLLAEAIHMVHSVDITDCRIYNEDSVGDCFIHGDFCLPNILAEGNQISGFIDTEAAGIGDPWMDYAWAIWSYEYNLGTKQYTQLLLDKLGIEFDSKKFEQYTG